MSHAARISVGEKAPGACRHAALVTRLDHARPEHGTDDELRAGVDHRSRRCRIGHGAGADQRLRQRARQLFDQFHRAGDRHGDLDRRHAAGHQRVRHIAADSRVGQAYHGDHAGLFDPAHHVGAGQGRRHRSPFTTRPEREKKREHQHGITSGIGAELAERRGD
jgi:hypothetical protein